MADDDQREGEDAPDLGAQRRRQAQGAASDLARMGIDPRSLGLDDRSVPPPPSGPPAPPASEPAEVDDGLPSAPVVPLRPEFAQGASAAVPDVPPPPAGPAPSGLPAGLQPPTAPPAAPAPQDRPLSTVEQLLARTGAAAPAPRGASRIARAVGRGLVTVDAAEAVQGDRELVDAVRHRQSDRRIVAFVAGKGGVGTTSVAVGVGTCFVALREDRSAVVDVQQGALPLAAVHGASTAIDVPGLAALDAEAPLPVSPAGLTLVDGVEWDLGLTRRDLSIALDRVGADHTFTLLDVGHAAGEGAHAAIARADQLVVVTGPGDLGLAALSEALDRGREVNPAAARRAVHVVVCPSDDAYRSVHREVVQRLPQQPVAVVVVPPDPHLALGGAVDPARIASGTREAYVRVAAAVALGTR